MKATRFSLSASRRITFRFNHNQHFSEKTTMAESDEEQLSYSAPFTLFKFTSQLRSIHTYYEALAKTLNMDTHPCNTCFYSINDT